LITSTRYQDTFPALKYVPSWFPGAGFKRNAKEWRKVVREVLEKPFHETKRNIVREILLKSIQCLIFRSDHGNGTTFIHVFEPT
jgi:hypothetical protein